MQASESGEMAEWIDGRHRTKGTYSGDRTEKSRSVYPTWGAGAIQVIQIHISAIAGLDPHHAKPHTGRSVGLNAGRRIAHEVSPCCGQTPQAAGIASVQGAFRRDRQAGIRPLLGKYGRERRAPRGLPHQ